MPDFATKTSTPAVAPSLLKNTAIPSPADLRKKVNLAPVATPVSRETPLDPDLQQILKRSQASSTPAGIKPSVISAAPEPTQRQKITNFFRTNKYLQPLTEGLFGIPESERMAFEPSSSASDGMTFEQYIQSDDAQKKLEKAEKTASKQGNTLTVDQKEDILDFAYNQEHQETKIHNQGILGFLYENILKSDVQKIEDRYNKLRLAGIPEDRATQVAIQDVQNSSKSFNDQIKEMTAQKIAEQNGVPYTPAQKIAITDAEQGILKAEGLKEKAMQGLESLDFIGVGSIARKGVTTIGKPALKQLEKLTAREGILGFVDNLFKNVDDVPPELVNDIADAVYDVQRTHGTALGGTQTKIDEAIAKVLRDSNRSSLITKKAGQDVIQLQKLVREGAKTSPDVAKFADEISDLAENSLKNSDNGVRTSSLKALRESSDAAASGEIRLRQVEDGRVVIEDGRHRLEVARETGVLPRIVDVSQDYDPNIVSDKVQEIIKKFDDIQGVPVEQAGKLADDVVEETAKTADNILPAEESVLQESKLVGAKRISPDRVPHQQLTPEAGIEALVEQASKQSNRRTDSYAGALTKLRAIQAKYGNNLPARTKANLTKYPDLAEDFRMWQQFKRYSSNGTMEDAISRFERFSKAPEVSPEQIAKLRASATKEYIAAIKKDISKGYKFPDAVLDYDPSFKKAVDARARYEKGLRTSFSADDSRIVFDESGKVSAGMKRQDGKELLPKQKDEIIEGVLQTQKALGIDLNDLSKAERWVYVHLNGKNPFLTKAAAGLYRKDALNKSVSISLGGIEKYDVIENGEKVTKRINTVVSHELGHALDYQTGNKLIDPQTVSDLSRTFKPVEQSFRGNKYWRSSEEVKARMIEQYVAIKEGHTSYFEREGYWSKEIFESKIKPAVEEAMTKHFSEYQKAASELPTFDNTVKPVVRKAEKGTAPARKADDMRTALTSPEKVAEAAVETQRKVSGTEPDGVLTAAKIGQAKEIPKTPAKAARFAVKNDPPLEIPDETRAGYLQRKIQDKFNRLGLIQRKIGGGLPLADDLNAYLQQEMFHGRAAERLDKFENAVISTKGQGGKALIQRMADEGITIDEMGEFLHAKHAPARNKRVAEINSEIADGGSGLTNKQAAAIIEKYKAAGKFEKMDAYSKEFYEKVTKARIKILEEEHLLKPEAVEKITGSFIDDTYVPLKIEQTPEIRLRGGRGYDVRGKDVKRLQGSTRSDRTNPLIQAIVDYEDAVIKAEKNKVGRSLKKLIEQNPNITNKQGEKIWEVAAQQYAPVYNKFGEVEYVQPAGFKLADNVMEVRDKGKIYHITMHDKALASAMRNLGDERGIKFLHQINNYLRAVTTFYNPEFMITNFERDIQSALINTGGEQGGKAAARVAKDVPAALRGIWRNTRGKGSKANIKEGSVDWAKEYQEMKDVGGRVGWFDYATVAEKQQKIQSRINRASGKRPIDKAAATWDGVAEWVSDVNESVESGVRLSAYVNAKSAGMTKEQAASLAKNLTVNFNKKGEWGSAMNSLYLFANAGVQGTARMFKALKHKRTRRIVGSIAAFSYGVSYMNEQVNKEAYDKIDDYEKNTNLIFMLPVGAAAPDIDAGIGSVETIPNTNEKYIKIKLPYGYNIFKVMGDTAYDMSMGKERVGDALKRLVFAMDESFNPLSSGSAAQLVSPTATDPLVQMYENKNFFGGKIKPDQEPYGSEKKQSDLYFSSVRQPTKVFTDWINNVSGGNEVEAGVLDFSPENVDHLIDFLGGGVAKFFANTIDSGVSLAKGDVPEPENTPFLRKFIGDVYDDVERSILYDLIDKSETRLLNEKELNDVKKYGKEALDEGQIDAKQAKKVITSMLENQNKIHAARVFEDIKKAETAEERKQIFDQYISENDLEKRKSGITTQLKDVISGYKEKKSGGESERGFIGTVVAGGKGMFVDPQNVLKAMLTEEKLGKVEGNLVELQRFYGTEFTEAGGSQEKKSAMLRQAGIDPTDANMKAYKLEHIVPVKAGGDTSDKNLRVIPTAEHNSYTPIDVAVAAAVQAGVMNRKEATDLMTRLKIDKSITPQEAYEEVKAKAK